MGLFKKKKQSLAANEHYTLKCNHAGKRLCTPSRIFNKHGILFGLRDLAIAIPGSPVVLYDGLDDFFDLQVSDKQEAMLATSVKDWLIPVHEHLLQHHNPLYMQYMAVKDRNFISLGYVQTPPGSGCLEYHGFDHGILHDRERDFAFNPTNWPLIAVAASQLVKMKGIPIKGMDYTKAVLPGIHIRRQTGTSSVDYQQQIRIAIADLHACAELLFGGNLEKKPGLYQELGQRTIRCTWHESDAGGFCRRGQNANYPCFAASYRQSGMGSVIGPTENN
jgi:hypothetical protein